MGTVGRETGQIRLTVLERTRKAEVIPALNEHRGQIGTCYSDEHKAYLAAEGPLRDHSTVCHSKREWARDDDGDGIREVHVNTIEGLWTECRNYLRRFKGVSKHSLHLYMAMFQWMYNTKTISSDFIQAMVFNYLGT